MNKYIVISMLSIFATGCSNPSSRAAPTVGMRMATAAGLEGDRADAKKALADQWKQGNKMASDGEKLANRAQSRMNAAERNGKEYQSRADRAAADQQSATASLAEGQKMVEEGKRLMAEAVLNFGATPPM